MIECFNSKSSVRILRSALIAVSVLELVVPSVGRGADVTEFESDLINERMQITQIILQVESETRLEKAGVIIRSTRQVWQDGMKRRCDEMREVFDLSMAPKGAPHRRLAIETENYVFEWIGETQADGSYLAAHWERPAPDIEKAFGHHLPFDARWFGVMPSPPHQMRGKPFDAIVGAIDRATPAEVKTEGEKAIVDYVRPSGVKVTQRYLRSGTQFVLEHFTLSSSAGRSVTMDCHYPSTRKQGPPYPEWVELKQTNIGAIETYDRSTIRVDSINTAIPPSIFTIEQVGLPIGVVVIGSAIPPKLQKEFHHVEWDGKKLLLVRNGQRAGDPTPGIRTSGSPLPAVGQRRTGTVWLIGGSLLLLVSALAFWVYRRRVAGA